ncbi:MAG: MBL fold metallo-hydrolase [Desulfotignum sp.]|nr:MBL fold metallo-hydrolase [Desulfobacteraceae bacterium]
MKSRYASWFGYTFLVFAGVLVTAMIFACTPKEKLTFSEKSWENKVNQTRTADLYARNVDAGRYVAPWMPMPDKSFLDVVWWKLFSKTDYTSEERTFLPAVLSDTARRLADTRGDFILWIGHNSFLVRINDTYWLTDPIFSKRALVPARLTPPALTLDDFNRLVPKVNIIISHNHYDHLDRATMKKLPEESPVFVPMGLKNMVEKMNKQVVHEMDWWEEHDVGSGSRLICLPAQHWSQRITQGRNRSLWASWLLITPDVTVYFGGDSGYFKGFKEIGRRFPGIDYAFMATTAYHPRWFMAYNHMNIAEAVQGFEELGAQNFIPTQWGTFHLGDEPAGYPGLDLARYITDNDLDAGRYQIMDIGQILAINPETPRKKPAD